LRIQRSVLGVLLAVWTVLPAAAHHSFAMYDRMRTVILTGIVKVYSWTSPHVTIHVLADHAGGGFVTWLIEGSTPSVLARGGWTSSLMKPGDKVSIGMHPRKDGAAGGLLADEQQMLINGQPAKGVLWLFPYSEAAAKPDCSAAN
jgi:hypothetical protein